MLEKAKRQCAVIFSVITILLIWVSYTGIRYFNDEKSKMNNIIMIIAIVIALTWLSTIPQVMRHKTSDGYQLRFTRKSTKVYSHFS